MLEMAGWPRREVYAALAWLSEHPAEPAAQPASPPPPLLDGEAVRQAALLAQSLRNAAKKQQRKQL